MPDWTVWEGKLTAAGDGIDDVVDELISQALSAPPDAAAAPLLVRALDAARSDLSRADAATALAWVAGDDDMTAVDCLERAYDRDRAHAFLAPSLLGAIGLLGLRNEAARAGAKRFLLRLQETDGRPLLVAGAKVIGLLCDREDDKALRAKLSKHAESMDAAVRAECRQQLALLRLGDALLAERPSDLTERLREARAGFALAEGAEETRPDAVLCGLLLDLVLQFDALELDRRSAAAGVADLAGRLRARVTGLGEAVFQGNRSTAAVRFTRNCLRIAKALEAAAAEVSTAARWTNFDESVTSLARCYAAFRYRTQALPGLERVAGAMSNLADRVLRPRIGPVLMRKVGRDSLAQVIANYRHLHGEDAVLTGLLALQEAEIEAERGAGGRLSEERHGKLAALAAWVNRTPDQLVDDIVVVVQTEKGAAEWAVRAALLPESSLAARKEGRGMSLPRVGIITALPEEFDAVRVMLKEEKRHRTPGPGAGHEYMLGVVPSLREGMHQVVLAQTMRMGNNSAAIRASKMLIDFPSIDVIVMCGIAGGVPNPEKADDHVRLGDIVVSDGQGVIQYDFGKQALATFDHRHAPRPPSASLLEAVQVLEQDRRAGKRPWDEYFREGLALRGLTRPPESTDVVLDKEKQPVAHPPYVGPSPRILQGPIASANCVQGDFRKRDKLREKFKIKAVEMEGSGIADASWEYEKAGYLIVRGICDYCDNRNKQAQTDAWKPYVAMAAAAYARALLEVIPGESPAN
jgi:nucleoside phosphorylase